jgi:selT/selW/selH-like putative selenoprotein
LAATLKKELGLDSEIVRGSGGIFVVSVDGKKIFSKHDEGRFPTEKEILDQVRKLSA